MNDHNKGSHTCVGFRKTQEIHVTISFSFFFLVTDNSSTVYFFSPLQLSCIKLLLKQIEHPNGTVSTGKTQGSFYCEAATGNTVC